MTEQTDKSPITNPEPMPTPIPAEETATPPVTAALPTNNEYLAYEVKQQQLADVEAARVRAWGYFLGSYLTGPVWPLVIASRTKVWAPFWAGLGLGVISLPFAFLDLSIISSLPAAGLGTYLMAEKSKEKRRKLNIITPEQADVMKFTNF